MRTSLPTIVTVITMTVATGVASAATLRAPTTGVIQPLGTSTSSSTSSSTTSVNKLKNLKLQKVTIPEYCAAIASAIAKGEQVTTNDATNKTRLDQSMDLLKKANALCGGMNTGAASSTSSSSSSACTPDGFMGVKGMCNGKSWSTGGVCMPKSYWETQVKQGCTASMADVSYEKPCVTKNNTCSTGSNSGTSSSSSACTTSGFMGAKMMCGTKPMSSGGVCKPKTYWEAWAKQDCSAFTGFEVQVPCTLACTK